MDNSNTTLEELKRQLTISANGRATAVFSDVSGINALILSIEKEGFNLEPIPENETPRFNAKPNGYRKSFDSTASDIIKGLPCSVEFDSMQEVRVFCSAAKSIIKPEEVKQAIEKASKETKQYSVNPLAEDILDSALGVVKAFYIILGIITILGGIIGGLNYLSDYGGSAEALGYMLLAGGIIIGAILIVVGYLKWAQGKVQINISRNLFNINEKLKKKDE